MDLKETISQSGLTQTKVAEILGVTPAQVNHWVKGRAKIPIERRQQLAKVLEVGTDALGPESTTWPMPSGKPRTVLGHAIVSLYRQKGFPTQKELVSGIAERVGTSDQAVLEAAYNGTPYEWVESLMGLFPEYPAEAWAAEVRNYPLTEEEMQSLLADIIRATMKTKPATYEALTQYLEVLYKEALYKTVRARALREFIAWDSERESHLSTKQVQGWYGYGQELKERRDG